MNVLRLGHGAKRPLRLTAALAAVVILPAVPASVAASPAPLMPAAAAPAPGGAPAPVLTWQACDDGFQCATARVPLSYSNPHGATISLAVIRHLATDPAKRIGSLFINGGGPGEQIEGFVAQYGELPAVLRERYDIVTFDPRGFGYSTAIRCFPSVAAENQFLAGLPSFPVGARQIETWDQTWARFDAQCAEHAGPLLDHDTSADVARDMNLLREAVGDPVLNYFGTSYGTGLGAIYANLFPGTVGRMILDGNLDPVAWTHADGVLTAWLRMGDDLASAATMRAFLDLCGQASTSACAFSAGTPTATTAKWNTLLSRLREHPVTIGNPPRAYTYADTLSAVGGALGKVSRWPAAASVMQQLWAASQASSARPAGAATAAASAPALYTGPDQQFAEMCADMPDPRDPSAYAAAAQLAYARSGPLGPANTWNLEPCAGWPSAAAQDRYTGPWNKLTASTILVIGNTGDPATPYQNSVAMSRDLARARLLTVDGYGHTAAANPSTCALDYEISYLLTGALPPAGSVCTQNAAPFAAPSGG
jgi:pimeloyl-ACP methyl ester carboxylesterase